MLLKAKIRKRIKLYKKKDSKSTVLAILGEDFYSDPYDQYCSGKITIKIKDESDLHAPWLKVIETSTQITKPDCSYCAGFDHDFDFGYIKAKRTIKILPDETLFSILSIKTFKKIVKVKQKTIKFEKWYETTSQTIWLSEREPRDLFERDHTHCKQSPFYYAYYYQDSEERSDILMYYLTTIFYHNRDLVSTLLEFIGRGEPCLIRCHKYERFCGPYGCEYNWGEKIEGFINGEWCRIAYGNVFADCDNAGYIPGPIQERRDGYCDHFLLKKIGTALVDLWDLKYIHPYMPKKSRREFEIKLRNL